MICWCCLMMLDCGMLGEALWLDLPTVQTIWLSACFQVPRLSGSHCSANRRQVPLGLFDFYLTEWRPSTLSPHFFYKQQGDFSFLAPDHFWNVHGYSRHYRNVLTELWLCSLSTNVYQLTSSNKSRMGDMRCTNVHWPETTARLCCGFAVMSEASPFLGVLQHS